MICYDTNFHLNYDQFRGFFNLAVASNKTSLVMATSSCRVNVIDQLRTGIMFAYYQEHGVWSDDCIQVDSLTISQINSPKGVAELL